MNSPENEQLKLLAELDQLAATLYPDTHREIFRRTRDEIRRLQTGLVNREHEHLRALLKVTEQGAEVERLQNLLTEIRAVANRDEPLWQHWEKKKA